MGNVLYFPTRFRSASTLDFGIPLPNQHTNVPCPLWDHNVAGKCGTAAFGCYRKGDGA